MKWKTDIQKAIKRPKTMKIRVDRLINRILSTPEVNLHPDYQRPLSWDDDDYSTFVEHWMEGGNTGHFFFNINQATGMQELVDGQHRLHALMQFLRGMLPVYDGVLFTDIEDREVMLKSCKIKVGVNHLNRCDTLRWYLQLNFHDKPHSEEDILKVRNMMREEQC